MASKETPRKTILHEDFDEMPETLETLTDSLRGLRVREVSTTVVYTMDVPWTTPTADGLTWVTPVQEQLSVDRMAAKKAAEAVDFFRAADKQAGGGTATSVSIGLLPRMSHLEDAVRPRHLKVRSRKDASWDVVEHRIFEYLRSPETPKDFTTITVGVRY